jgi:hypothetical protein
MLPVLVAAFLKVPMRRLVLVLFLLPMIATTAVASQPGLVVIKRWASMDKCAQKAREAFPDYTAEANARRDDLLQACLAGQNLPPRDQPIPAH